MDRRIDRLDNRILTVEHGLGELRERMARLVVVQVEFGALVVPAGDGPQNRSQ